MANQLEIMRNRLQAASRVANNPRFPVAWRNNALSDAQRLQREMQKYVTENQYGPAVPDKQSGLSVVTKPKGLPEGPIKVSDRPQTAPPALKVSTRPSTPSLKVTDRPAGLPEQQYKDPLEPSRLSGGVQVSRELSFPNTEEYAEFVIKQTTEAREQRAFENASNRQLIADGLVKGWLQVGSSIGRSAAVIAKKLGDEDIAWALENRADQDAALRKVGLGLTDHDRWKRAWLDPKWLLPAIAENTPNMLTAAGLYATGGAILSVPFIGLLEGGAILEDAKSFGASDDVAEKAALIGGLVNATLESTGIGFVLNRINKQISQNVSRAIIRRVMGSIIDIAASSAVEGVTESLQEIVSNAVAKEWDANRSIFQGVGEAGFIGAVMGSGSTVGGAAASISLTPFAGSVKNVSAGERPKEDRLDPFELSKNPDYSKILKQSFGEDDVIAQHKEEFYARPERMREGVFYHFSPDEGVNKKSLTTGQSERFDEQLGPGLYLGRDRQALKNFYGLDTDGKAVRLAGNPKILDLTESNKAIDDAYKEAKKQFPKEKYPLALWVKDQGFDGIKYFDPLATGEEFVIYNPSAFTQAQEPKFQKTPTFQGLDEVSTEIVEQLQGRKTVSKQFIEDLTKRQQVKQAERDIIIQVLEGYKDQDTIPAQEFANAVATRLLPLKFKDTDTVGGIGEGTELSSRDIARFEEDGLVPSRYENVSLPVEQRGPVENYFERIYESPIPTSGGDDHFGSREYVTEQGEKEQTFPNYFAHTRVEDLPTEGHRTNVRTGEKGTAMDTEPTRRVIEIQSDLFQKGRLESESALDARRLTPKKEAEARKLEIAKLEPYRNTWWERIIREEARQAAIDGKTKLQFPTGETAMKIEGLGGADTRWHWNSIKESGDSMEDNFDTFAKVDTEINDGNADWIITDVLGDGKFKAVRKEPLDQIMKTIPDRKKALAFLEGQHRTETFDISNKVDTENPIYIFYEKNIPKFLNRAYGKENVKRITDPQKVTWWELKVPKEAAKEPVRAFQRMATPGGGEISTDPTQADLMAKGLREFGLQPTVFAGVRDPISMREASKAVRELLPELGTTVHTRFARQIFTPEGEQAIGQYHDGFITFIRSPDKSTPHHEVVHAYLDLFTDPKRKARILEEVKKQYGITSNIQAEEFVADGFVLFVRGRKKGWRGVLQHYYEYILDQINYLAGRPNEVRELYRRIVEIKRNETQRARIKNLATPSGQHRRFQKVSDGLGDHYLLYTNHSKQTAEAFTRSQGQALVARVNNIEFELGQFGHNHQQRKTEQFKADRFDATNLAEVIRSVDKVTRAATDARSYRSDNAVWLGFLNGQRAAVYTRQNARGAEEIISWHLIDETKNPEFIKTLESYGNPARIRTEIPSLEGRSPFHLADEANTSVPHPSSDVNPEKALKLAAGQPTIPAPQLGDADLYKARGVAQPEPDAPTEPTTYDMAEMAEIYKDALIYPDGQKEENYQRFKAIFRNYSRTEFEDVEQFKKIAAESNSRIVRDLKAINMGVGDLFYSQEFTDDEVFQDFVDRFDKEKEFVPETQKLNYQVKEGISKELRSRITPFFLPGRNRTSRAFALLGNKDTSVPLFEIVFEKWAQSGVKAILEPYAGAFTLGTHSLGGALRAGLKEYHANIFDNEKYILTKAVQDGRLAEARSEVDLAVRRISSEILTQAKQRAQGELNTKGERGTSSVTHDLFSEFMRANPRSFIGSTKFYEFVRSKDIGKEVVIYKDIYEEFRQVFQDAFDRLNAVEPTDVRSAALRAVLRRVGIFGGQGQPMIRNNGFQSFESKIYQKYGLINGLEDMAETFTLARNVGASIKLYNTDGAEFVRKVRPPYQPKEIGIYFDPPYVTSARTYDNVAGIDKFVSGFKFVEAHRGAFDLQSQGSRMALTNDVDEEYIRTVTSNIKNHKIYAYKEGNTPTSLIITQESESAVKAYLESGSARDKGGALRTRLERIRKIVTGKKLNQNVLKNVKAVVGVRELKNGKPEELDQITEMLKEFQEGDEVLTPLQREGLQFYLETGWPERDHRLVTKREMMAKFGESSEVMSDGALVSHISANLFPTVDIKEGHPIIERVVDMADELIRAASRRVRKLGEKFDEMYKEALGSRDQGLFDKKTNDLIFKFMGGDFSIQLTPEERALADFMAAYFAEAKKRFNLDRWRTHYIPHLEKTLTEKILKKGVFAAIRDYAQPKTNEIPQDVLLALTHIIGSKKFFHHFLERKDIIDPTTNLRKIFEEYSRLAEMKVALDAVLPEGQAATQLLLVGKSATWLRSYLQNLRGRGLDFNFRAGPAGWLSKVGNKVIDLGYIKLLGINYKSWVKNVIGGEVNAFVWQRTENYMTGKWRMFMDPFKAYRIVSQSGVLDGTFVDFAEQRGIMNREAWGNTILYSGMKVGEYEMRGAYLLGEMTAEEYAAESLTPGRFRQILNGIAVTQGVYTSTESPLMAQTMIGRAALQFNRWRITNAMLARRVAKLAAEDARAGNYSSPNVTRFFRMLVVTSMMIWLNYELAKAGWKTAAKMVAAGTELFNNMIAIFTGKAVVDAIAKNPTLELAGEVIFSIQSLLSYISGGIIEEPQTFEINNGINESYVAPIQTFKDLFSGRSAQQGRNINPEILKRAKERSRGSGSGPKINPAVLKRVKQINK